MQRAGSGGAASGGVCGAGDAPPRPRVSRRVTARCLGPKHALKASFDLCPRYPGALPVIDGSGGS